MQAKWWHTEQTAHGAVAQCTLCFHACRIPAAKTGYCGTRYYDGTGLTSPYLGQFTACAVDPIEKKPLYHWQSGTQIFSLGSVGCTMRCPFCQNHDIAQPKGDVRIGALSTHELVQKVQDLQLTSVAYTYNEPTLQAEYIVEAAPLLQDAGIHTVLVSNGMFSEALLKDLTPWVAAANIDIKTFDDTTYSRMGGSLATVKRTVEYLVQAGVHVELTTLVVPGISDAPEHIIAMTEWIAGISADIPLHLSRYFPAHTYTAPATSVSLLQRFASLAGRKLRHVHLGNVR